MKRSVTDRWWFTLPALTLLLLTPTLHHGQPFLTWDTAQYYHYGAQLVGFATEKIGLTIGLNVQVRQEIVKQHMTEMPDAALDSTDGTTPNSFDKAWIAEKPQA